MNLTLLFSSSHCCLCSSHLALLLCSFVIIHHHHPFSNCISSAVKRFLSCPLSPTSPGVWLPIQRSPPHICTTTSSSRPSSPHVGFPAPCLGAPSLLSYLSRSLAVANHSPSGTHARCSLVRNPSVAHYTLGCNLFLICLFELFVAFIATIMLQTRSEESKEPLCFPALYNLALHAGSSRVSPTSSYEEAQCSSWSSNFH